MRTLSLCIVVPVVALLGMATANGATVTHSAAYPEAFSPGKIYPTWDNGILIAPTPSSVESFSKEQPNVVFYDREGAKIGTAAIWVEGASRVRLRPMAVSPRRQVLAGGSAISQDGSVIGFITITDIQGKPSLTITTNPYVPEKLVFDGDGNIWALVSLIDLDGSGRTSEYNIVRHYSGADGKLLLEALPRSRFALDFPPAVTSGGGGEVLAQSGRNGLGAFFARQNLWVEVDNAGHIAEVNITPLRFRDENGRETGTPRVACGLAYLDAGTVYACFGDNLEIGLFKLDKTKGRWVPMPGMVGPVRNAPVAALYGSEGAVLVVSTSSPGKDPGALNWLKIE